MMLCSPPRFTKMLQKGEIALSFQDPHRIHGGQAFARETVLPHCNVPTTSTAFNPALAQASLQIRTGYSANRPGKKILGSASLNRKTFFKKQHPQALPMARAVEPAALTS